MFKAEHSRVMAIWRYRKSLVALGVPLLLAPFPAFVRSEAASCAYVILWMAVYFVLEPVPLSVTALLPVAAFPLLGVLSTAETTMPYMKDTIMMYLGGLTMAVAVEDCGLHKRVALRILLTLGTGPRQLMLGFMVTTMFLSMWISNTATTAMMVPIVQAVLEQLDQESKKQPRSYQSNYDGVQPRALEMGSQRHSQRIKESFSNKGFESEETKEGNHANQNQTPLPAGKESSEKEDNSSAAYQGSWKDKDALGAPRPAHIRNLKSALYLSVAFSANLGGTGTPIGSGPNVVLQGYFSETFPMSRDLSFAKWMLYNIPGVVITSFLTWIILQLFCLPCSFRHHKNRENENIVRNIISSSYEELGPVSARQKKIALIFFLLIMGWFFRDPSFIQGWASFLPHSRLIGDASASIAASLLLFVIPEGKGTVLEWKTAQRKLPWGLLLLLGSGFAVAEAAQKSGLSTWLGDHLTELQSLPSVGIMVTVTLLASALTELISNMSVATIVLPVVFQLAKAISMHPLYLALPVTIGCSYAFILPVGNPSNAIVYESSGMTSLNMMVPGLAVKVICLGIQIALIQTLGRAVWDLDSLPLWADTVNNSTAV